MILQVGVKILLENEKDECLFLKRKKVLEHGGSNSWDIPGGRIKNNESLMDALKREIKEETGLKLTGLPKLIAAQDIIVEQKDLHVVRLTYVGTATGDLVLSDEHMDFQYMNIDQVKESNDNFDPYLLEVL